VEAESCQIESLTCFFALLKIPAPKEKVYVIREVGDQLELTLTGTGTEGSPISWKEVFPLRGGVIKFEPALPEVISIVETVVNPGEDYTTILQNGMQLLVSHWIVSKDGKTLHGTTTGTDPQGNSFKQLEIYDKH
jgi:hypothetical protein